LHQRPHLLGGEFVAVLRGRYWPGLNWRNARVAIEAELGEELVGPSADDGHSGGVPLGVVVVPPLRARFCVAAGPHRDVHGVNRRIVRVWMSNGMCTQSNLRTPSSSMRPILSAA
jgi:hypothetical protein